MIGVICNDKKQYNEFRRDQHPGIRELLHCVSEVNDVRGWAFVSVLRIGGSMELLHHAEFRIVPLEKPAICGPMLVK